MILECMGASSKKIGYGMSHVSAIIIQPHIKLETTVLSNFIAKQAF